VKVRTVWYSQKSFAQIPEKVGEGANRPERKRGYIYEQDITRYGFKSTAFSATIKTGVVVQVRNGSKTYSRGADIAYHLEKFRRGVQEDNRYLGARTTTVTCPRMKSGP